MASILFTIAMSAVVGFVRDITGIQLLAYLGDLSLIVPCPERIATAARAFAVVRQATWLTLNTKKCVVIPIGGRWLRAGLLRALGLAKEAIKDWLEMRLTTYGACLGVVIGLGADLHSWHATWGKFGVLLEK